MQWTGARSCRQAWAIVSNEVPGVRAVGTVTRRRRDVIRVACVAPRLRGRRVREVETLCRHCLLSHGHDAVLGGSSGGVLRRRFAIWI